MSYWEIMPIQLMTLQKETPHWYAQDFDKEVWYQRSHMMIIFVSCMYLIKRCPLAAALGFVAKRRAGRWILSLLNKAPSIRRNDSLAIMGLYLGS